MHAILHVKLYKRNICGAHDIHKDYSFNQSIADEFAAQERDNMEVGKLKILLSCIYPKLLT